jgi:hypothetical protein
MRGWFVVVLLAGCGDNRNICDYSEHDDTGTLETTGLTVGDTGQTLCGSIDGGHFDEAVSVVDRDTYRITVGGSGELLVELTGDPDLALLGTVSVHLFDTGSPATLLAQSTLDLTVADHSAVLAKVPPGDVDVVVEARATGDLVGALPYRVRIVPAPSRLCSTEHDNLAYTESHDGDAMTGNDVALVDFTKQMAVTGDGSSPEATDISLHAGENPVIAGALGVMGRGDQYLDRDTFAFSTDDWTNELLVRLDWPDADVDVDYLVLDPDTLAVVGAATRADTLDAEFSVVAVRPNTRYLLWIGRYAQPAGAASSESYDATLCGNYFY